MRHLFAVLVINVTLSLVQHLQATRCYNCIWMSKIFNGFDSNSREWCRSPKSSNLDTDINASNIYSEEIQRRMRIFSQLAAALAKRFTDGINDTDIPGASLLKIPSTQHNLNPTIVCLFAQGTFTPEGDSPIKFVIRKAVPLSAAPEDRMAIGKCTDNIPASFKQDENIGIMVDYMTEVKKVCMCSNDGCNKYKPSAAAIFLASGRFESMCAILLLAANLV